MFWKTFVFTFLLVGVFAEELKIDEEHKDQLKELLRRQCQSNNAEDKVDEVSNVGHTFFDCVKSLVNMEQIRKEIEEAKPNGALDEVFKKYCAKTPQLKSCIHTLLDGISPCLDSTTRDQVNPAKNGTDQLIDFVCYKDGDRIALFISEHGPECFREKLHAIRDCGTKVQTAISTVEAFKAMSLADKCGKFDEVASCIVAALEQCDTPTPGNMAESLFKYVRKDSPCNTALPKN